MLSSTNGALRCMAHHMSEKGGKAVECRSVFEFIVKIKKISSGHVLSGQVQHLSWSSRSWTIDKELKR